MKKIPQFPNGKGSLRLSRRTCNVFRNMGFDFEDKTIQEQVEMVNFIYQLAVQPHKTPFGVSQKQNWETWPNFGKASFAELERFVFEKNTP